MTATPVAVGLFTWPSGSPQLIGGRCGSCATTTFPMQASCPRCTRAEMREHLLARTGTLWTYTVQNFEPKPPYLGPTPFVPYGVGYVELDGVLVESRLTENDPSVLSIGQDVELSIRPFRRDALGNDVLTFMFGPRSGGSR